MRQLRRPTVSLPTLTGNGKGARAAAAHRLAKEGDPSAALDFSGDDHWNEPDVRGALYAMHAWVCAYCQCELPRNDRGDVDHFRPKLGEGGLQGYWWLAYEFGNYLLACRVCNSQRKGCRFPLEAGACACSYVQRVNLDAEKRLLADPTVDPVEEWMRLDWMGPGSGCFVKATVRTVNDPSGQGRAAETIRFFRLNDDIALLRERVQRVRCAQRAYRDLRYEELRRMASRFQPHGISVRNFLQDVEPSLLPTREEELSWLLDDISERMEVAGELLTRATDRRLCRRYITELAWALAVLWNDPPAGSPEGMERWLDERGWRDLVEPFYKQLQARNTRVTCAASKPAMSDSDAAT